MTQILNEWLIEIETSNGWEPISYVKNNQLVIKPYLDFIRDFHFYVINIDDFKDKKGKRLKVCNTHRYYILKNWTITHNCIMVLDPRNSIEVINSVD